MVKQTAEIAKKTGKIVNIRRNALPGFLYQNGYTFCATDLGNHGVKIELIHENDVAAAIILPPGAVGKCGKWLLETIGQDKHGLPNGLSEILRRLSKHSGIKTALKRGDKKTIKDAIRALRS